jgi:hypothetical protein
MNTNRNIMRHFAMIAGMILVSTGAFLKISHIKGADILMLLGLIELLTYTIIEIKINHKSHTQIQTSNDLGSIVLIITFAVGLCISAYEAYLKTFHLSGSIVILIIGALSTLIFILTSLNEVLSSTRIKKSEKIMWTICLILLNWITGFVYLISGRKRIIPVNSDVFTSSFEK